MTAIEFVQKFGWDKAKKDCQIYGWKNTSFLIQLKSLVKSNDLVQRSGGLNDAREHLIVLALIEEFEQLQELSQAIADVESVESLKEQNHA